MRMFGYYFFHTAWNQLKTFVRTWAFVLFLLLFGAGGALIYAFRWYYSRLAAANDSLPSDIHEFFEATGLSGLNVFELAAGLLILCLLIIQIIGAEKSVANLFRQADVNLLFASDLPPQAVLAFRVSNTLGLAIAAAVYLAIRLPFLAREYSLTAYSACTILLAWCMTLVFCVQLKMMIYEIGSRHPIFRGNFRWVVFALLAAVGFAFYRAYDMSPDKDVFLTAQQFFNAPVTRFIPVWGWTKGMMLYALEGNVLLSVCLLVLNLALIGILAVVVMRLPADYYEETLSRAQEAAMLEQAANSEGAALLVMQARSREVRREGFHHGYGSSVYFFRVLHNRMRTSKFFVTKTMLTYCCAALAAGLYVRYFLDEPISYIPSLVLAAMVFFHTIISPVTEDIRMTIFLLQPEMIWKKLFFSLLGGSVNCALDAAIPLMIGQAAAGFSPLGGLLYLPVLAGVDYFASASGTFTDVSIPSSIGIGFKQVIQILLLYVGLIFDGACLLYGINSGHSSAGFLLVTVINVVIGSVFLGLTGVWLYPCSGREVRSKGYEPDRKGARRTYTQSGLALTAMFLSIKIAQGALAHAGAGQVITLYLPIYLVGLPVFLLLMRIGRSASKAETGQGKTDQGKTDQGKTDQAKTGQGKTDQAKTGQAKTGQAKTGQGKTGQGKTGQAKKNGSVSATGGVTSNATGGVTNGVTSGATSGATRSETSGATRSVTSGATSSETSGATSNAPSVDTAYESGAGVVSGCRVEFTAGYDSDIASEDSTNIAGGSGAGAVSEDSTNTAHEHGIALTHEYGAGIPHARGYTLSQFLLILSACFFVMYTGNILGYLFQGLLRVFLRHPVALWDFGVSSSALPAHAYSPILQALLLAFAAPFMEEYVFRRCLITRLLPYGEKTALIMSALLFALFHGSVNQICYAFLLGLIFGYVYLKTGKLRYSVMLHMIINSMTSILMPILLSFAARSVAGEDLYKAPLGDIILEPGVLVLIIYIVLVILMFLLGSVTFFFGIRERALSADNVEMKTAITSWGIVLFLAVTIAGIL